MSTVRSRPCLPGFRSKHQAVGSWVLYNFIGGIPGRRNISKEKQVNINQQITAREVRVIDEDGNQLGILPFEQAMTICREKGLDLVEVSPGVAPPVCRIMDFGKFKYQQKKKQQEAKKKQTVIQVKEIKLRPKTEDHDIQIKIKHILRFLEEGDKAKVSVVYRGREMAHTEFGFSLMQKIIEGVGDKAVMESPPKMEGRTLSMLLGPKG